MAKTGPFNPTRPGRVNHRGITLVELLVVISILMILAAVAIPTMRPALENRRIREAARAVNVCMGAARAHAMATGRPCGVMFDPLAAEPGCSMVLQQASMPPPYAGDTLNAMATLRLVPSNNGPIDYWLDGRGKVQAALTDSSPGLVQVGDLVQFNHQGPFYEIRGPDADAEGAPGYGVVDGNPLELAVDLSQGQMLPWGASWSAPVPYEIFRQPVKSPVQSQQLPTGAVIDFDFSGSYKPGDTDKIQRGALQTLTIVFSPNGSVERTYIDGWIYPPIHPIYLLVGKREKVGKTRDQEESNLRDLTNLWVAVNPRTGLVTTTEVAPIPPAVLQNGTEDDVFAAARFYARQAQSMGGR